MSRINFYSPLKDKFMAKAVRERGSMTTVLNEWIEAYLKDDLFSRKDMVIIFSSILVDLGMADRVADVDDLIDDALEKSYEKLALSHSALTGGLKLPPGKLLRRIRKEKRMSLQAVADAVSKYLGKPYSSQSVSRLELQPGTPRKETIEPFLSVYGYTYEQFMERLENQ